MTDPVVSAATDALSDEQLEAIYRLRAAVAKCLDLGFPPKQIRGIVSVRLFGEDGNDD